MNTQPKPTEAHQTGSAEPLGAESEAPDPTRICWTQLLREEPSEHAEPLPLKPPPDDIELEKLLSSIEAELSTKGGEPAVANNQHFNTPDKRQPPDMLLTEPER